MLLCVDIGNTHIKLGLFDGERLAARWRLATDRARLADEYAVLLLNLLAAEGLAREAIRGCAISSVVPALSQEWAELARRYLRCEPVSVGPGVETSMVVQTDYPAEVGTDLIVSAV